MTRREHDFYPTPTAAVEAIYPYVKVGSGGVFDPAAGDGAILDVWRTRGVRTAGLDIQPQLFSESMNIRTQDALGIDPWGTWGRAETVVVMNPPYKHAREFVARALAECDTVFALLRLGFLGSRGRRDFHVRQRPDVFVLSWRPSFTGNGKVDMTDYAWFHWHLKSSGRLEWL